MTDAPFSYDGPCRRAGKVVAFPRAFDDKHLRSAARVVLDAYAVLVAVTPPRDQGEAETFAALAMTAAIGDLKDAHAAALARAAGEGA